MLIFSSKIESPQHLEELLVGRKDIVDAIERSVILAFASNLNAHYLLVGARGSGKTHIIHVLFNRLSKNQAFNEKAAIAYMAEEEIGIDSLFSLFIRIFDAFIRWGNNPEEKIVWNDKITILKNLKYHEREDKAKEYLLQYLGHRKLLLLIENINDVFSGMKLTGQSRLRDFIQQYEKVNIIATSQVLFPEIQNEDKPFHNFFQITHLDRLGEEETKLLLSAFARTEGPLEIETHFQTNQGAGQMKSIHFLSGGNHRLIALFYEFLKNDFKSDMAEPFLKTLDKLKPYYESFIRYLPPQQQKIVHFLAIKHQPQFGSVITKECFMSPGGTSKQLNELQNKGFVESIKIGRDNKYELAEPMMRFCIELTENRDGIIGMLARFITVLYSDTEIINKYLRLKYLPTYYCHDVSQMRNHYDEITIYEKAGEDKKESLRHLEHFIQQIEDESAKDALIKITMIAHDRFINCPYVNESCPCNIIMVNDVSDDKVWKIFISELIKYSLYKEAFSVVEQILTNATQNKNENLTIPILFVASSLKLNNDKNSNKEFIRKLLKLSIDDFSRRLIAVMYDFEIQGEQKSIYNLTKDERSILDYIQKNIGHYHYPPEILDIRCENNNDRKEQLYKQSLGKYPNESFLLNDYAGFLAKNGKIEEAEEYYLKSIEHNPDEPELTDDYGSFLLSKKKDIQLAKKYFLKSIELDTKSIYFWSQYVDLLEDHEKNIPEAEKIYKKMMKLFPNSSDILQNYGIFQYYNGHPHKAVEYLTKSLNINSLNDCAYYFLGRVYYYLGDYNKAIENYSESLNIDPNHNAPYFDRSISYLDLFDYKKAEKDLMKFLNSLTKKSILEGINKENYPICISTLNLFIIGVINNKKSLISKSLQFFEAANLSPELEYINNLLKHIKDILFRTDQSFEFDYTIKKLTRIKSTSLKDYSFSNLITWLLSDNSSRIDGHKKTYLIKLLKKFK